MLGKPHVLENYLTRDGAEPFHDWLTALRDIEGRHRINIRLDRIEHRGHFGKYGHIGEGVYELKIDTGPGYRVYFGLDSTTMVLLCGGDKSTQKKDIARAIKYWRDYNA